MSILGRDKQQGGPLCVTCIDNGLNHADSLFVAQRFDHAQQPQQHLGVSVLDGDEQRGGAVFGGFVHVGGNGLALYLL